jgi:hypothetical protein
MRDGKEVARICSPGRQNRNGSCIDFEQGEADDMPVSLRDGGVLQWRVILGENQSLRNRSFATIDRNYMG